MEHSLSSTTKSPLGEAVGLSEGRISTRLSKLAEQGLTISPQCVPGRAWALSAQAARSPNAPPRSFSTTQTASS
jgi:hypothetical protein